MSYNMSQWVSTYRGHDGWRAPAAGWWIFPAPQPGSRPESAGWWRSEWRRSPCPGTCCPLCCAGVQTGSWDRAGAQLVMWRVGCKQKNPPSPTSHLSAAVDKNFENEFLMLQKFRFLGNLRERLVEGGAPHQYRDEFGSVRRLHHALLLRNVEMDDLLFEMFVIQQLLQDLSKIR